jgi:predicted transcriptional regulator
MNSPYINPANLLEISGSYWKACPLHAGIKLDIFTALGRERLTSQEIVQKLHSDKRGVTVLLNALTAMNFVVKKNDTFITGL